MSEPVSYVIATYNDAPEHLRQAVTSALRQTHRYIEVVVVDDGSETPVTTDLFDGDARVTVVRQDNAGPSSARNAGLARAHGEIIIFLDGDDWVDDTHAEEAVSALRDPGVTVAVPAVSAFGTAEWSRRLAQDLVGPDIAFENQIPIGSACRRAEAEAVHGFDEELRVGLEDHEFWLRLLLTTGGRAVVLPTAVLHYRMRPGQRSERQFTPEASAATREALLRNLDPSHLLELSRGLWNAAERQKALRHEVVSDRLYLRPHYARLHGRVSRVIAATLRPRRSR